MAEHWVLNASPLIALGRSGHVNLLFSLANELIVPRAVAEEVQAAPEDDPAIGFLNDKRIQVIESPPPPVEILAWDLGAGETAVISFALANKQWTAILDDGLARKCARSFAIRIKGTLAIVLMAKQQGLIESAAEAVRSLRRVGFHLDDRIVRQALAQAANEEWNP